MWYALPCDPQALQRGVQRRACLSDPTHPYVFHRRPIHGSWLNQIKLWFSVLTRRFLKWSDLRAIEDFVGQLDTYLEVYNTHHAHPYRWTYTGQSLMQATPLSQTRCRHPYGRVWFCPPAPTF
jgi:hypothetical protein